MNTRAELVATGNFMPSGARAKRVDGTLTHNGMRRCGGRHNRAQALALLGNRTPDVRVDVAEAHDLEDNSP